jgi:mannose-6-phosphate isomerase-like protein (cupin superfamily)
MIEEIRDGDAVMALILRRDYKADGIKFLTPDSYSQQLGYMNRPEGYVIKPHVHNLALREVHYTNEVLFIKSGKVRVDFYGVDQQYRESRVLETGDIILLIVGGHGFEMLEASEIVEVKQGPYVGEHDKIRFEPVAADRVKLPGQ